MTTPTSLRNSLALGLRPVSFVRRQLGTTALGWLALGALLLVLLGTAAARTTAARRTAAASAVYTVKATAYEAVASQTDSKPFVTADNSRIPRGYGSHTRWLALSRDLLRPWGGPFAFGDKVRVQGISPAFDGVYTVHDTMNRRYHHCLDVLVHPREHVRISQVGVKLQRVSAPNRRNSSHPLLARKAAKKLVLANRRASTRRELAQHHTKPRTRGRAKQVAVAAAPHAAKRTAKQASRTKRPTSLAHQKRTAAKTQLTTLPKRSKKRVA